MKKKPSFYSRKFDKYAGIPLLFGLTGFGKSRQSTLPPHIRRVAILRTDSMRDTAYIEVVVNGLKKKYPNLNIVFFASVENFNVAKLLTNINKVVKIYKDDFKRSIHIIKSSGEFDIWIDFGIYSRFESILTHFAKSYYKIGFRTEKEHRHFVYDSVVEFSTSKHILELYADMLKLIKFNDNLNFVLDNKGEKEKNSKLVIFNMYPDKEVYSYRKWDNENWKYLLSRLNNKGYKVAIVGDKIYTDDADKFSETIGDIDVDYYVGRLDEEGYISLLSKSDLLVSVDSWLLIYAAMMNVPNIGIYGPTTSKLYAPLGKNSVSFNSDLSCSGCQNIYDDNECSKSTKNCMSYIDVINVEKEVFRLLKDNI